MGRPPNSIITQSVTIRIPATQVEHLKQIARELSIQENCAISYTDLIRRAIGNLYPLPRHDAQVGLVMNGAE